MKINPENVPNLPVYQKQELINTYNRLCNIAIKFTLFSFIFIFFFTGIFGWALSLSSMAGDTKDIFLSLLLTSLLMILSLIISSSNKQKYILLVILLQFICFLIATQLHPIFGILPIISIILYFRVYDFIPIYDALKKEEGFPYFFEK